MVIKLRGQKNGYVRISLFNERKQEVDRRLDDIDRRIEALVEANERLTEKLSRWYYTSIVLMTILSFLAGINVIEMLVHVL